MSFKIVKCKYTWSFFCWDSINSFVSHDYNKYRNPWGKSIFTHTHTHKRCFV